MGSLLCNYYLVATYTRLTHNQSITDNDSLRLHEMTANDGKLTNWFSNPLTQFFCCCVLYSPLFSFCDHSHFIHTFLSHSFLVSSLFCHLWLPSGSRLCLACSLELCRQPQRRMQAKLIWALPWITITLIITSTEKRDQYRNKQGITLTTFILKELKPGKDEGMNRREKQTRKCLLKNVML